MSTIATPDDAPAELPRAPLLVGALAAVVAVTWLLAWCFCVRSLHGDELGLLNPVYMCYASGQVTYPMHGQWDTMTVHPPTNYWAIATLMRLGLSADRAAGLHCWLLLAAFLALVLTARRPAHVKAALLLAAHMTLVFFGWNTIRPEIAIALAWLAGLAALEHSRSRGWGATGLALGGFFLAYASALHYWSAPAWVGGLAYLAVAVWAGGARRGLVRALAFGAGAAVVAAPYVGFFLVPHRAAIREMLSTTRATGSVSAAYASHLEILLDVHSFPDGLPLMPSDILFRPVRATTVIPALLAAAVLLPQRRFRLLALAGLPLPLFVALSVQRKAGPWYLLPEVFLSYLALAACALGLLARVAAFLPGRRLAPAAALLCGAALAAQALEGRHLAARPIDRFELCRAAARQAVGDADLLLFASNCKWYTGGGGDVCFYTSWGQTWEQFESGLLGMRVTAVFCDDWFANQPVAVPFPHWYLQGRLRLRGFTLGGDATALFVGPHRPAAVVGYCLSEDLKDVRRFDAAPGGDHVFFVLLAEAQGGQAPIDLGLAVVRLEDPSRPHRLFYLGVWERGVFKARAAELARVGTVHEAVAGTLRPADVAALLPEARTGPPLCFHRSVAEAAAKLLGGSATGPARPVALAPLGPDVAEGWAAGASSGRMRTSHSQDAWQAQGDLEVEPHTLYRARLRLAVEEGGASVHAFDPQAGRVLFSLNRPTPQPLRQEGFVFDSGDARTVRLVVANNLPNGRPGRSRLTIRDFEVQKLGPGPGGP
jgi:hypothetical protein